MRSKIYYLFIHLSVCWHGKNDWNTLLDFGIDLPSKRSIGTGMKQYKNIYVYPQNCHEIRLATWRDESTKSFVPCTSAEKVNYKCSCIDIAYYPR